MASINRGGPVYDDEGEDADRRFLRLSAFSAIIAGAVLLLGLALGLDERDRGRGPAQGGDDNQRIDRPIGGGGP